MEARKSCFFVLYHFLFNFYFYVLYSLFSYSYNYLICRLLTAKKNIIILWYDTFSSFREITKWNKSTFIFIMIIFIFKFCNDMIIAVLISIKESIRVLLIDYAVFWKIIMYRCQSGDRRILCVITGFPCFRGNFAIIPC